MGRLTLQQEGRGRTEVGSRDRGFAFDTRRHTNEESHWDGRFWWAQLRSDTCSTRCNPGTHLQTVSSTATACRPQLRPNPYCQLPRLLPLLLLNPLSVSAAASACATAATAAHCINLNHFSRRTVLTSTTSANTRSGHYAQTSSHHLWALGHDGPYVPCCSDTLHTVSMLRTNSEVSPSQAD